MAKKTLLDELISDNDKSITISSENEFLNYILPEIDLIKGDEIRSFVRSVLLKAGIFWEIPSSFSGKYHPPDEHNSGGCALHTKRVVRIVNMLADSYSLTENERDNAIAAALIHDVTKGIPSESKEDFHYDPMHPYTVNKFVMDCIKYDKAYSNDSNSSSIFIDEEDLQTILRLVRCHLGPWSPVPETIPITYLDYILHVADNVASKLHIIIEDSELYNPKWKEIEK
jgi:hypothetical protein